MLFVLIINVLLYCISAIRYLCLYSVQISLMCILLIEILFTKCLLFVCLFLFSFFSFFFFFFFKFGFVIVNKMFNSSRTSDFRFLVK